MDGNHDAKKLKTDPHDIGDQNIKKSAGTIPHDIVVDILLRTPGTSLIRFKRVCKVWCSLINDPDFINQHLDHATKNSSLCSLITIFSYHDNPLCLSLINDDGWIPKTLLTMAKNKDDNIKMLPSCNGLICLYGREDIYICNPIIREILKLPRSCSRNLREHYDQICGFGFYVPTKEYKVIRMFYGLTQKNASCGLVCEVFTLGVSKSWKRTGDVPYRINNTQIPMFVNGSLYWMLKRIVSFDIGDETFKLIPLPKFRSDPGSDRRCVSLVELCGSLCLINDSWYGERIDIWMLKDDRHDTNHVWIKEYSIALGGYGLRYDLTPICIRNGKIIFESVPSGMVSYDIRNNVFTEVYHSPVSFKTSSYVESLVSVFKKYTIS